MVNRSARPRVFGRRRLLAAAVAAVVAVGLVAAYLAFRDQEVAPEDGESNTYRDPAGAWEIAYPDRFTQGTIPGPSEPGRGVTSDGIWIANFDAPRFDEGTGAVEPLLSELPDSGLVVSVYQVFGEPPFIPQDPDSSFPISFEDLEVERGTYRRLSGGWRADRVVANGEPYTIGVRLGPDATAEDQKAAAEIVSSFRALPLREGTTIGRHLTFYVLGPPDAYPVGSVTRLEESTLPPSDYRMPNPFYLVHVPEGFYALAWPDKLQGAYKHCDVTYDPPAREFSCPSGARWALDGSVIEKPGPTFPDDPLGVLLVRISLDDHVLVSPNVFMADTKQDLLVTDALSTGNFLS
jgi:hypothetical protein